ncbi:MAG: STAS domain-containing protein [Chroococcales cyanobacterium]
MNPTIAIVEPSGILDGTQTSDFRQQIHEQVAQGAKIILVDFKNVPFMDSSGLGALVLALKNVRAAQGQIYVCSINDSIRMLFELTTMDRVFEVFPNQEAFSQKFEMAKQNSR